MSDRAMEVPGGTNVQELVVLLAKLLDAAQLLPLGPKCPRNGAARPTCPDAVLEHHLATVINAIDGLKKVPEAEFKNATEVRIGAALAWQRLLNSVFGSRSLMLDLVREWFGWPRQSRVGVTTAKKLSGDDLGPLAVAFAVEVGLSLLFLFRRGTLPNHPGLSELRKLVAQGRDQIFDTVWAALGCNEARGAVRDVISRFTKFVGQSPPGGGAGLFKRPSRTVIARADACVGPC
jgi:hypothetical protein